MNTSIKKELLAYIRTTIEERLQYDPDFLSSEEIHNELFNMDYYIIGYYEAEQWLEKHDVSAFEAIETVQEYELSNFGETSTDLNSESIVNTLVYIYGEELLYTIVEEMKNELEEE